MRRLVGLMVVLGACKPMNDPGQGYPNGYPQPNGGYPQQTGYPQATPLAPPANNNPPPPGPETSPPRSGHRPPLSEQRGQYFKWATPAGWRSNETSNGVDLMAADGVTSAGTSLLMGAQGNQSPRGFIAYIWQMLQLRDVSPEWARDLPDQSAGMGMTWKIVEEQYTFTDRGGHRLRANVTCGIMTMYGSYSALVTYYAAPKDRWEHERGWLPALGGGIAIINPRGVAQQDRLIMPRNNPNPGVGGGRDSDSDERISQNWREATMGYHRVVDAQTGTYYDMPQEAYDRGRGGYVNPNRPTELLSDAPPGE